MGTTRKTSPAEPVKRPEKRFIVSCGDYSIDLSSKTHIMGVLNRTPDSFSDGGKFISENAALDRIAEMVEDGADIIDIGGESTRPGATPVSPQEEMDRVLPVIEKASRSFGRPVSIDTMKASVATAAVKAGASIINDVSGMQQDDQMIDAAKHCRAAVIIMHMKGTPQTMQDNPVYDDLIREVVSYLNDAMMKAMAGGVSYDRLIVDPGIGFGKTVQHNLEIVKRLDEFRVLGRPVAIGVSRKSFIGTVLRKKVDERQWGTAACSVAAVMKGARIIRAHDVKETKDAVTMADAILKGERWK